MSDMVLERLKLLQERLRRIIEEVERDPDKQVTLAEEMAGIHSETEKLLVTMLPAEQR